MAHLWIQSADGWDARKLEGEEFDLAALAIRPATQVEPRRNLARIVRVDAGGTTLWALIASADSDARVRGRVVPAGLCALSDRDEIRSGAGVQCFFSTETLAAAEPFPGSDRAVFCGRCRQQIEMGSLAVCCPVCGIWYNQSSEFPCWTYSEKCAFCGAATALDSGFAWSPED